MLDDKEAFQRLEQIQELEKEKKRILQIKEECRTEVERLTLKKEIDISDEISHPYIDYKRHENRK